MHREISERVMGSNNAAGEDDVNQQYGTKTVPANSDQKSQAGRSITFGHQSETMKPESNANQENITGL